MEPLKSAVEDVMSNLEFAEDEPKEFGPIMIAVISEVIVLLLQYCAKRWNESNRKNPSLMQRWTLRRYIKSACPDKSFYHKHGDRIYAALLRTGKDITEEKLQEIINAENNK